MKINVLFFHAGFLLLHVNSGWRTNRFLSVPLHGAGNWPDHSSRTYTFVQDNIISELNLCTTPLGSRQ